jgi:hypothetical protein
MPRFVDWDKVGARLGDEKSIKRLAAREERARKMQALADRLRLAQRRPPVITRPPLQARHYREQIINPRRSRVSRPQAAPGTPGAVCAACGASTSDLEPDSRFCIACGAAL